MPSRVHYLFPITAFAVFAFILIAGLTLFSSPAYADPHAVFYTDRAQEQVFYNVLAGLNQADYVEPGIPGVPYSRQNLVNQRATALANPVVQFTGETDPLISYTHTDLPGVVSRNITLEGNDLWTAYIVNQFSLETATRRSASELARVFCEEGLGRVRCDSTPGITQQQDSAFTRNPLTLEEEINVAVNSALSSGQDNETTVRREITSTSGKEPIYSVPRPHSPSIAELNKNISNNREASQIINSIKGSIIESTGVDSETFKGVTFDEEGVGHLAKDISAEEYMHKLRQLSNLPSQYAEIAQNAAEEALAFQNIVRTPSTMAQFILERSPGSDGSEGVVGKIIVPANVTDATARLAPELPLIAAAQQKYTNPSSIQQGGNQSLVDPNLQYLDRLGEADSFQRRGANDPIIASNFSSSSNGTVAGISTLDTELARLSEDTYTTPQGPDLSPGAKDQPILLEPGIFDVLRAITGDTFRKGLRNNTSDSESSFGFKLDELFSRFTLTDVLCSVYPLVESCLSSTDNIQN